MAKILPITAMRAVGVATGGPSQVETFTSGGALKKNEFVYLSSGKLTAVAIIGALDTNDLLDADTGPTAYTAPLVGMTLNAATAVDQPVKVAIFRDDTIFEANLIGSATSGTAANIVSGHAALALTHIGAKVSFILPKVAVNHAMVDDSGVSTNYQIPSAGDRIYALSTSTTGTTPLFGRVVRVDFGLKFEGNSLFTAKGTIGDKNARVQFQLTQVAAGYTLYGSPAA